MERRKRRRIKLKARVVRITPRSPHEGGPRRLNSGRSTITGLTKSQIGLPGRRSSSRPARKSQAKGCSDNRKNKRFDERGGEGKEKGDI